MNPTRRSNDECRVISKRYSGKPSRAETIAFRNCGWRTKTCFRAENMRSLSSLSNIASCCWRITFRICSTSRGIENLASVSKTMMHDCLPPKCVGRIANVARWYIKCVLPPPGISDVNSTIGGCCFFVEVPASSMVRNIWSSGSNPNVVERISRFE